MTRIAIIGAGISGLVVARGLSRHHAVTVFEKSGGVGGRMATRYAGRFEFDHGAQFFTARTRDFQAFLRPLLDAGVVANWSARFAELAPGRIDKERRWSMDYPHYVGAPRMNAIGKWLAQDLDIRLGTEIADLRQVKDEWCLVSTTGDDLGRFDWVVSTAPAPQTRQLAPDPSAALSRRADRAIMQACCALMLGFERSLPFSWQAALVRDADISWISLNGSKPGRNEACTLVAHSTNAWADQHLDDDPVELKSFLITECSRVTGVDVSTATHQDLHRWRFANVSKQQGDPYYLDMGCRFAACGDWFIRGRVEGAFTSGHLLAAALERAL